MAKLKISIEEIYELIKRDNPRNMNTLLNPQIISYDEDENSVAFEYEAAEWELNQRGQIHGGAVSGMFDTAMGISALMYSGKDVTTAEMEISYIRPFIGSGFRFDVKVLHIGKRMARVEAKAYSAETGKLLATSHAAFAILQSVYEAE